MKAFVVEDSRLARVELKELLLAHHKIQLCGEAENTFSALPLIEKERPDLLFLDINLPGKNGFELLEMLSYQPKVIFITAHADYAIHAFEFDTVDYLLKPISAGRLKKAIDRLTFDSPASETESCKKIDMDSKVLLRDGEICNWVQLQDIAYFDSQGNYTAVYWGTKKALIYRSLNKIEQRVPEQFFFRCNRQQVVNINHVILVEPWVNGGYRLTLKSHIHVDVSRRHALRFKEIFCL
jgi:two-component system, LytTR family, response regulator